MYSTNVNIFEYQDFRKFLSDVVIEVRKNHQNFSFRNFASAAGFSSPNFLLLLIQGERNLSSESCRKIAKAFGLDAMKSQFLDLLVRFNQAQSSDEKISTAQSIFKFKIKKNIQILHSDQFEYYSDWIHVAIRELLLVCSSLNEIQISELLIPRQSVEKVRTSLDLLQRLGLLQKTDSGWRVCQNNVATGDSFSSAAVFDFHKQMIQLGKESLDRFSREERNVTATTLGLSERSYVEVIEKISDLRKEILAISDLDKNKNQVYQFNFQLFPLTKNIIPPESV
jgi:uncharacterized protein (TIGR02147 family)